MCLDSVYVVFENGDGNHLLKPFLNKTINHCYLIIPSGKKLIIYDKSLSGVQIYTIDKINDILKNKIVINVSPRKSSQWILMINSCVGHVKRYLGISNPFILTPYQLYRSLQDGSLA